jgi:spore coat protein U-like protein
VNKILATIAGVALTVLPAAAFASGSATGNVSVSANVQAACTLVTGSPLAFGNYDPTVGVTGASTGNESIQCTNTTTYTFLIPTGATLTGPGGATINASNIAPSAPGGTGNGSAQNFTLSGDLAAGQYSTPGAYSGSILVTANF